MGDIRDAKRKAIEREDNSVHRPTEEAIIMASGHIRNALEYLGFKPDRPGMKETPLRYAKFLAGFTDAKPFEFKTFNGETYDEMVLMKDIPFFSLCEHHLAPIFGHAHVAYIPSEKIVGLSKIPRTVDKFARRPTNQERLCTQIADELQKNLLPKGVAVVIEARHLCVEMRGIEKHGCITTTSHLLGAFKSDLNCRQEFLHLISKHK